MGRLDKIKLKQMSIPIPIPTANGDHVDSYSQFILALFGIGVDIIKFF
jgi:hypothetical protein